MPQYEPAANFGRASKRHFIDGYNVVIEAGDDDNILFHLQDPCVTMSNQCTAKAIVMKAYRDYLIDNGLTPEAADQACKDGCCCDFGGPNVSFYAGTYTLSFATTEVGAPVAPVTVFVPLPLTCDTLEFPAYTTAAP